MGTVVRRDDPSLAPPWQKLYDSASNLEYFWNPNTNVTQYERPAGDKVVPFPAPATELLSLEEADGQRGGSSARCGTRRGRPLGLFGVRPSMFLFADALPGLEPARPDVS